MPRYIGLDSYNHATLEDLDFQPCVSANDGEEFVRIATGGVALSIPGHAVNGFIKALLSAHEDAAMMANNERESRERASQAEWRAAE